MREVGAEIGRFEAEVIGVGGATHDQARALMDAGVGVTLLVDPPGAFRQAVGLDRMPWWRWLWPRTAANWLRSVRRAGQGRISWTHTQDLPGLVIIDPVGRLAYVHRGRTLGDYPPAVGVMDELRRLTA